MTVILQEATCPVCGVRFKYPKCGFRPMTCPRSECQQEHKARAREDHEIAENMRAFWVERASRAE